MQKIIITLAVLIGIVAALPLPLSPTHQQQHASLSYSVSSNTIVPQLNNVDVRVAYVTNGANYYMFYADGSNVVHRWLCTTPDNCTVQSNGILDSSFSQPYGDDRYWLSGSILYNNTYYSIVHVEFRYRSTNAPNFNWFRRIGLASSADKGAHWHYVGDVITSDFSTDISDFLAAPSFEAGPGDVSVFADWAKGYVYVSYTTFWADVNTGARNEETGIARCPISSIAQLTCWYKFDYGNWTQPGLGGHNASIFPGQDNASISWDTYLGEYIAVGHSTNNVSFISTATNMDSQNWQPLQHFVDDSQLDGFYIWLLNSNGDPFNIGQVFRVYEAANDYNGIQSAYFTVTLS